MVYEMNMKVVIILSGYNEKLSIEKVFLDFYRKCPVAFVYVVENYSLEFIEFRYVYKIPSAILATGLMIFSLLFFAIGLILDTIVRYEKFNFELRKNS